MRRTSAAWVGFSLMIALFLQFQPPFEQPPALVQPPFHGSDRQGQEFGHPLHGPLFPIPQPEHQPELFRQLRQRGPDPGALRVSLQLSLRVDGQLLAARQEEAVQLTLLRGHAPAVSLGPPPGAAPGDGAEPRRKSRGVVQLRQRLERQQERFLRDVLRGGAAADALLRHRQHRAAEPADQLVERLQVAEERAEDQFFVVQFWEMARACSHSNSSTTAGKRPHLARGALYSGG